MPDGGEPHGETVNHREMDQIEEKRHAAKYFHRTAQPTGRTLQQRQHDQSRPEGHQQIVCRRGVLGAVDEMTAP